VEFGLAKSIMIQGTASNVGKSLIAAGLCRIFKQDGFRVAPFKSQNMALNSFITREGLEMGRAQVVQAEAAGIEPTVDMNPILLKPTGDTKSQVIVQGEVFENLDARQYYQRKKTFVPKIRESFERLSAAFDIIVIEGAGSPAEINLRENDIVNMFMAALAQAPVLLAGDIDRGGVFAALAGTMLLFTEEERRFVKGTLINKFRGDVALLEPGLRQLEDIIRRPVLGVIPYREFDIDDEDSLSGRFHADTADSPVRIAVVQLPHISNFTDFNALGRVAGLGLGYARDSAGLRDADLIIIPGTKNTMADLRWARQNGMAGAIVSAAGAGTPVLGICGGYQMLGKKLKDPLNVEGGGEMEGLGLLPLETIFSAEKTRTRVTGAFAPARGVLQDLSGLELRGYEIHMGITLPLPGADGAILARIAGPGEEPKPDGFQAGNVYGTYVHGVFDTDQVARTLAAALYRMKGLEYSGALGGANGGESFAQYKERQYDLLAEYLRAHLDMEQIYRILNKGLED
jgi:adenosylcobyric acid synthase